MYSILVGRSRRRPRLGIKRRLFWIFLLIEGLDELIFGLREVAWPWIRADLGLSLTQVGLLLSLPSVVGCLVEPIVGVRANGPRRIRWMLVGGVVFAAACAGVALAPGFWPFLIALCLLYPASGAFVGLAQATLVDLDPARRVEMMARWTLAGYLGLAVAAPVISLVGGHSWRWLFVAAAMVALVLTLQLKRTIRSASPGAVGGEELNWREVTGLLRDRYVRGKFVLLIFADLGTDVLGGFLALYLLEVPGGTPTGAAWAVGAWLAAGLAGNLLLVLRRGPVSPRRHLLTSAAIAGASLIAFLAMPTYAAKLIPLCVLGFATAGWYPVLQGQLYDAMPGKSGAVMALGTAFDLIAALVPLGLGAMAEVYGLDVVLWVLVMGPALLFAGSVGQRAASVV